MVADVEPAVRFLSALFHKSDTILFRPIETWVEADKKRSRVDYKNTCYRKAAPACCKSLCCSFSSRAKGTAKFIFWCLPARRQQRAASTWRGRFGQFARSGRTSTTSRLTKHVKRVVKAGLPSPSIIVNSGHGVHLHWLLDAPYLIDDAGDPPSVEKDWIETHNERKKPRKFVVENGEKIYLDQRRHVSRLSPKAVHVHDVLAGIAKTVGGDHTTDLSRLLRLPGTLNRKDERNGKEPVPTALVECDPNRKYSLATFERFKSTSPETERSKHIAAMPLPKPRKISTSRADKLNELIAACSISPAGSRSEADFALCCFAVRNGIAKEHVWSLVQQIGKFAEAGERYFDRTWENAEYDSRAATFEKLQQRTTPKARKATTGVDGGSSSDNNETESGHQTITVDTSTVPVADTLHQVTDRLLAAGNCFSRADQLVAIYGEQIAAILSPPELAGLLNQYVEFYFMDEEAGQYKPFPPAYANTFLNNHIERSRFPAIKLFTRNPVFTDDWRLVATGFDAGSGIYYAGPPVEVRNGTGHLDALLRDFCFKKPADRTNYLGMLLTAILVPRFIGSKPAALFSGNQPELGKSMLAQIIAILRDGQTAETASYNSNDEEFKKRLGAIVRRGDTVVIVDNAKSRGRNPRIESACLERSITDPLLSFWLLGQSSSIRAENSHIFCITAKTPDVSRDLVTRSVVINMFYEGDPERREFSIADPEGYAREHRLELLGELVGMVERWKAAGMPMARVNSRFNKRSWGNIVGGILAASANRTSWPTPRKRRLFWTKRAAISPN